MRENSGRPQASARTCVFYGEEPELPLSSNFPHSQETNSLATKLFLKDYTFRDHFYSS